MPYEHEDELSKSELKRLCTLNPLEMADRLRNLEIQLVDYKVACEQKQELLYQSESIYKELEITCSQLIKESQNNRDLYLDAQSNLRKLETQLVTIQEMFSNALQSDLEHGVKCLNENASKEFHEKYPELAQALRRLSDL